MKYNRVISVFDGMDMQKYFLLMTKEVEKTFYKKLVNENNLDIDFDDYLNEIKNNPHLKTMIQETILYSISNIDWDNHIEHLVALS